MLASPGSRLEGGGQRRVGAAFGAALEAQGELRLEAEAAALADLEAGVERRRRCRGSRAASRSTAIGSQLVGLRVKSGRSSLTCDRADVERDRPARIAGIGSVTAVIWAVFGSTCRAVLTHDGAEVEGPGRRRGDDRQAERGAFVGAGEVGLAGGVVGGRAGAGADVDACRPCEAGGQLGLGLLGLPALRRGGGQGGLGAGRDAGELADQARRRGHGDGGELLGAVLAAQVDDEGAVGAGDRGDRAGVEGGRVGHGRPASRRRRRRPGLRSIAQVSDGLAGGPESGADHGVSAEVVE